MRPQLDRRADLAERVADPTALCPGCGDVVACCECPDLEMLAVYEDGEGGEWDYAGQRIEAA